jgi:hypothetical protein
MHSLAYGMGQSSHRSQTKSRDPAITRSLSYHSLPHHGPVKRAAQSAPTAESMVCCTCYQHFSLYLWKTGIQKRRHLCSTLCELLSPVAIVLIFVALHAGVCAAVSCHRRLCARHCVRRRCCLRAALDRTLAFSCDALRASRLSPSTQNADAARVSRGLS